MPSGNWSFPCSPRNPAKVREELRLFRQLAPSWRLRGLPWSPRSGAQLEFGRELRLMAESPVAGQQPLDVAASRADDDPAHLRFRTQAPALTDDNVRWTARARFGTYKFFGFVSTDAGGYADLTDAGRRFVDSPRPGDVLLRQLLKWQYPDNQHRGSRWPAEDFAIFPFVATARLIRELGGLTRQEIALFCFTMRRTEDAAATAEAIRQFRERQARSTGRAGKARSAQAAAGAARARYAAEGRRVVLQSTDDYADALIRSFRYTGLFSARGARIVVASGREGELDEVVFDEAAGIGARPAALRAPGVRDDGTGTASGAATTVQLALGEAPPVRLAAPRALFTGYEDAAAFYAYYGDAQQPRLPWEDPVRLAEIARSLDAQVADLAAREAHLKIGRTVLTGPAYGAALPAEYDALAEVVDGLRRRKLRLETALYAAEQRTPKALAEALDFYGAILAREVIDPPTYLEWNTWRVFLALDRAREIRANLQLDGDLQPLNTAQGNQPDMEIDYQTFVVVAEVTLRTGADQRQAETRPVTRHILEAQRRYASPNADGAGRPVYGLFLAPKIHPDTATDFFVALKYRVIERQQIAALPLTLRQFEAACRPFAGDVAFDPAGFRRLLERLVEAGLAAETGDEWLAGIDAALRHWLAALGAPPPKTEGAARALPLPLFAG
jgi:hypothetical protein